MEQKTGDNMCTDVYKLRVGLENDQLSVDLAVALVIVSLKSLNHYSGMLISCG